MSLFLVLHIFLYILACSSMTALIIGYFFEPLRHEFVIFFILSAIFTAIGTLFSLLFSNTINVPVFIARYLVPVVFSILGNTFYIRIRFNNTDH